MAWVGLSGVVAIILAALAITLLRPGSAVQPSLGPGAPGIAYAPDGAAVGPPKATPLANGPGQPVSSGVTATITTKLGNIVIEVFDQSAPVASTNFLNLASNGFYNGTVFHRLVPGFVIQGGDPNGTGGGGPGYTIKDEPIVGQYARGIVAMARTQQPNSQGSQFFIVLDDGARRALDAARTYTIFGRVTAGMDVVDAIAAMPNAGDAAGNKAIDPVAMDSVTVQLP
jgi:cyclophilin family peptidyl-prolyl cis-trans isomerase